MRLDVLVASFYMHARRVVPRFDAKEHQELSGYALYESPLTYVAHLDLVGVLVQGIPVTRVRPRFITKIRKILYVGYRRIFPKYVA